MDVLTKNKAELLRVFFTNPGKSFYMQEIGRILGKKPGVFQRTLNKMVAEGVLESERKANTRHFWANNQYPLYKELKSIIFKTVGIQGSLREALNDFKKIRLAFIYGSFAKIKENNLSDIDIMIIGEPNESVLIARLDKLENQLQREINYHLYSLRSFKSDIKNGNPFLKGIIRDKKIMLIGSENELRQIY